MPKLFKVGGCVRDSFLGIDSKDIDFTFVLDNLEQTVEQGFTDMETWMTDRKFQIFLSTPEMFTIRPTPQPVPVLSVSAPPENNITFYGGPAEMLKVTEDGFYVRGVKVEADEQEAAAVYKAFKSFLVHHALTRD